MMDGERAFPFSAPAAGLAVVVVAGQDLGAQTAEVDPVPAAVGVAAGAVAGDQPGLGAADPAPQRRLTAENRGRGIGYGLQEEESHSLAPRIAEFYYADDNDTSSLISGIIGCYLCLSCVNFHPLLSG